MKLSQKQQKIIALTLEKGAMSSSSVREGLLMLGEDIALVTVKRLLTEMADGGVLSVVGSGRSTSYTVSDLGKLFADIDARKYCAIEPDKRYGANGYNFNLFSIVHDDLFDENETKTLNEATDEFNRRTENLTEAIQKKELERLIIELSWKSSKIEGNTYTLLDTEKLILENKEAVGHDKKEARMILNHKDAFNFIRENISEFKNPTRANMEKLHAVLVKDLNVNAGLRKNPVGIVGSKYKPLDNIHQISEAVDSLSATVSRMKNPYAKALMSALGISYIQPFEDGNKRTARLMANAVLLAHGLAPLSYRSVDEAEYREAIIVFYEINSIVPFKKIFVGQYDFAARNYAVK